MITLEVQQNQFRLAEAFTISRGSRTEAQVLTVCLIDGAYRGMGECVPYARYGETVSSVTEQIQSVAPLLTSDLTPEALLELLPAGAARNAVDCALWDLMAKRSGTPVWQLLDLPQPEPVTTAYTLSLDTPSVMQRKAAEHRHRPVLKLKLGGQGDIERLQAVRAGAPATTIVVDANEGWSASEYQALA
ncbi:MAG: hypothetical protein KTR32_19535, partial [Granulosicoccus sp.]|nr:hypothetical protein [Granulosicoccus sp.]